MASRGVSPNVSNPGSDTEQELEATQEGGKSFQLLDESLEMLSEKRSSTREEGLSCIIKQLKMNYNYEFIEQKRFSVLEALKKGLKKGGAKEQQLSCETLSLVMLTVEDGTEEIYKDFAPTLQELAVDHPNASVRIAAQDALSMCNFIASVEEPITIAVLDVLWSLIMNGKRSLMERTSAIRGWTLLLTVVNPQYVFAQLVPTHLAPIVEFLKSDDVDIRLASGECIALLIEISRAEEGEDFDQFNFVDYANVDLDGIIDQLYILTSGTSKGRTKKEKAKEKAPFKSILQYIESGEVSGESLSFKHQKFEFSTWTEIIQLNALRRLLDEGLAIHFEKNDLMQDIFDIFIDKGMKKVTLSQHEKRFYLSPNSAVAKAKTKELSKQRRNRRQEVEYREDSD